MSLGNREDKAGSEAEPEELPDIGPFKTTCDVQDCAFPEISEAGTKPNLKQKNQWSFTVR